ncbi:lipopolysaccharide biosynthesis protein [Rhodanobacter glycinis]|uniref:Membrane protein involved in the export of O-antigen and teichoic acid n=1 Tax=Rhodanobacter glycinis TaxID=582702 RepID=A0A1I4BFF4_9GAMM|nr:MATE family efflux transporter [Rhodanobacter glycinis]SFK67488.1 Membrane protein involved in the export of O-antigen and teichoic acid [Rhodanobacter glycinis]
MSAEPPSSHPMGLGSWIGDRGRKIIHTGFWSLIAKGCAASNLFMSVPFALHALGPEQFGAWVTLVSLVTLAGFLDFGFGNGTMNLIASAHSRQSKEDVASILHESRRVLRGVASGLAVVAIVAIPLVPWYHFLGMPESAATQSRIAVAIVLLSVILAVPLNIANRVQLGLGRGDRAFRWQAIGQVAALAAVISLASVHASLALLTGAAVATPLLASFANNYSLWHDPSLTVTFAASPERRLIIGHQIRREGLMFFLLQLSVALAFSADLPLISIFRGSAEAGTYAIVQRLFSVIPLALSLVWAPLWPIYRQALVAGDQHWVMRTLHHSLILAVAFAAVGSAILAIGFDQFVSAWVHRSLAVAGTMLAGFAFWCVFEAAGTAIATFLNAASCMRYQLITSCTFAVLCFGGKVWVVANIGITWIPWVTVVAYCLANVLPLLWFRNQIFPSILAKKY